MKNYLLAELQMHNQSAQPKKCSYLLKLHDVSSGIFVLHIATQQVIPPSTSFTSICVAGHSATLVRARSMLRTGHSVPDLTTSIGADGNSNKIVHRLGSPRSTYVEKLSEDKYRRHITETNSIDLITNDKEFSIPAKYLELLEVDIFHVRDPLDPLSSELWERFGQWA
ncbi:9852_t:CDS:2, partial [Ambispora gerdemannii]